MAQHHFALALHRQVQGIGIHIRVAVAVAAHPLAHAEKSGDCTAAEFVFQVGVQLGNFRQKSGLVIAHGVFNFVGHGEFGETQQTCLPQLQHAGPHQAFYVRQLARAGGVLAARDDVVPGLQTGGDAAFRIQNTFALHLGRVRG